MRKVITYVNIFLVLIFFVECTFTTTKTFEPKFKNGAEAIQSRIESIITCQHINVIGIQQTTDNHTERELRISIINAMSLPTNIHSLRNLAKNVAIEFKEQLVNRGEFDIYNIMFVEESEHGSVKSNGLKEIKLKDAEL